MIFLLISRSSRLEVVCKKITLKIQQIYRKTSVPEYLFNKVASWKLKPCNFKNETPVQVLSGEFSETFKNTYFAENFELLYLNQHIVINNNYHPPSETSVFFLIIRDHRKCLVSKTSRRTATFRTLLKSHYWKMIQY